MIRMLRAGFSLLLLTLFFSSHAQTDLQQLRNDLERMNNGPEKIQRLMAASRSLLTEHPTVAFGYARQAITTAANLGLKEQRGDALSNLGFLLFQSRQYNQAISHLDQTITWKSNNLTSSQANQLELAKDCRLAGNAYEVQGKYEQAYSYYTRASDYAKKGGSHEEMAYNLNRMGEVQVELQNFQQALNHFNVALGHAKQSRNPAIRRTVDKNIGTAVVLLQNYLEKQEIQMEVEEVQERIEGVRDSLTTQQDSNKILVSTTNLLTMQRKRDSAELRASQLEKEALNSELVAKEAREQTFILATAGGGLVAFLLIMFFVNRSRLRKKAKEDVEQEKQKTEELLFSILPTEIAKELIEKKSVMPREYDEVSILFTDFKGFTRIAADLSPEQLISELNYVFRQFDDIVEQYGLEKIKTIGDAYMAVAGVPDPHPDHALATVAAALKMQEFMHKWKVEKEMRGERPWELRVGINSGNIVAGVIGNKKFAYDVWGDAVNIAARMESAGEAWEVNVSEDTYQLVRDRASCMARGPLPVKNKGTIPMYFVKTITSTMSVKAVTAAPAPWWQS